MGDISILDELFLLNGDALVPPELPQNEPRGEHPSANDSDVTRKLLTCDLSPTRSRSRLKGGSQSRRKH